MSEQTRQESEEKQTGRTVWTFQPTENSKDFIADAIKAALGPNATPRQKHGWKTRLINEAIRLTYGTKSSETKTA